MKRGEKGVRLVQNQHMCISSMAVFDRGNVLLYYYSPRYAPHRNANNYVPSGFAAVRDNWRGLCSYAANANNGAALCNIPTNTHAWRVPAQYNPGFMCGMPTGGQSLAVPFEATLSAKNGVPTRMYQFLRVAATRVGSMSKYSEVMVSECAALGMKPVCDHPSYCKDDPKALYIGQTNHIAHRPQRSTNNYMPGSFASIRDHWDGLCSYTANANTNYALCNIPTNTHAWRSPEQYNPGFVCGAVLATTHRLSAKNGVPARAYAFRRATTRATSGSYAAAMVAGCARLGMKPVCDHASYCRNDNASLFLGQASHLADAPHLNTSSGTSPVGLAEIRGMWSGLCSYTANANGNSALCNVPVTSYSWKNLSRLIIEYKEGLVCKQINKNQVIYVDTR